jgi:MutS domain V
MYILCVYAALWQLYRGLLRSRAMVVQHCYIIAEPYFSLLLSLILLLLYEHSNQVFNGHMKCLVDKEGKEQRVTFLYTLAPGPCPKSFGINVARLAQLPEQVRTTVWH